jgi:Gpi18-like mannosyltransferase
MSIKDILKKVITWRLLVLLVAIPAIFILAPRTRFTNLQPVPSIRDLSTMWSNFDGLHYLDLAQYGYGYQHKTDMDYAFFPVYPWLIGKFSFLGSYLASALFISHLCLILALYFLFKLVRLDFNTKISRDTIYLLLIFPAAFFFGSVYNESLFLLLTVLTFFFARKKNFILAGIFAAIASATRVTGMFLWPALIYEFYLAYEKSLKKCLNYRAISLLLPPLGILGFMYFQKLKTGNPFLFIDIQSNFAERTTDKLILLYQVFFRYFKMLIFIDHTDPLFFSVLVEFLSGLLILVVLIFSLKKIRFSYWLFVLLSYILPSLTGTFMSMPRFTIVMFPIFIYLSAWLERHHPYFRYAYYFVCFILSVFMISFFTRGYFMA